jgi:hypothetical protein
MQSKVGVARAPPSSACGRCRAHAVVERGHWINLPSPFVIWPPDIAAAVGSGAGSSSPRVTRRLFLPWVGANTEAMATKSTKRITVGLGESFRFGGGINWRPFYASGASFVGKGKLNAKKPHPGIYCHMPETGPIREVKYCPCPRPGCIRWLICIIFERPGGPGTGLAILAPTNQRNDPNPSAGRGRSSRRRRRSLAQANLSRVLNFSRFGYIYIYISLDKTVRLSLDWKRRTPVSCPPVSIQP